MYVYICTYIFFLYFEINKLFIYNLCEKWSCGPAFRKNIFVIILASTIYSKNQLPSYACEKQVVEVSRKLKLCTLFVS